MRTDTVQLSLGKTSPTVCKGARGMSWTKSGAHVISRIMKLCLQILGFGVADIFIVAFTCPIFLVCIRGDVLFYDLGRCIMWY